MNRTKLNLVVDSLALACAVFMVATGFILEYVLPPGSGRLGTEGHGVGPGGMHRPIQLLWGLTRHEWGDVHFWTALILMATLSLHLVLHWRWIVSVVKGQRPEGSGIRVAVGILAFVSLLALAVAPFVSPTIWMPRGEVLEQRQQSTPVR
jgi:hypothetical protein